MNPSSSLPATMAAVLLTGHGGPEKLVYRTDVPVPRPAPGEKDCRELCPKNAFQMTEL